MPTLSLCCANLSLASRKLEPSVCSANYRLATLVHVHRVAERECIACWSSSPDTRSKQLLPANDARMQLCCISSCRMQVCGRSVGECMMRPRA